MALIISKKVQQYEHQDPITKTINPIMTGSSVIGLTFNKGVIIGTDTLCSYGSMARFRNVQRIENLNNTAMIASSGEFSDFQEVFRQLKEMTKEEFLQDDKIRFSPRDYGNYLARVNYKRRNKFNPNYMNSVIGGFWDDKPYLASVDLFGTYLESPYCLTGFADYMCKPIVTNYWNENCDEEHAKKIVVECFKNLFYRDARANDNIQIAVCTKDGVQILPPFKLDTTWDYKGFKDRANEKFYQAN